MVLRSFLRCLILLFIVFPLVLISTISQFLYRKSLRSAFRAASSSTVILVISVPILFLSILALSEKDPLVENREASQLEELKLKVADLESIIHENNNILRSKINQIAENSRQIKEMELNIESLKNTIQKMKVHEAKWKLKVCTLIFDGWTNRHGRNVISFLVHSTEGPFYLYFVDASSKEKTAEYIADTLENSPGDASYSEMRLSNMEEEVGHLWAALRKNNFDIHILEVNAHEDEEKLNALTSEVKKIESVVSEQWVQIQQIEQALLLTKIRTKKISMAKNTVKCTVLKFVVDLRKHHLPKAIDWLGLSTYTNRKVTFTSKAMHHLKKIMSKVREYHHEFQYSVKHALESNEFTASLANEEFIFFLASALIISPMLIAFQLIKG